jgi:hypothetical protein
MRNLFAILLLSVTLLQTSPPPNGGKQQEPAQKKHDLGSVSPAPPPVKDPPWVYVLLGWVGGIVATVIGSWISSKIKIYQDERKSHRDELQQRVLIPLHDGLEQHFRPLVFNLRPVVTVAMGATTHFDAKAKATDEQIERGDVLLSPFPASTVFGSLDTVLLEDARKNHFPKQLAEVDRFMERWIAHASECHAWVSKISQEILAGSGLPPFPPKYEGPGFRPYVIHRRLAVFIYKRLFQQQAPALRVEQMDPHWTVNGEGCTAALGSKEQMDGLVALIDKLRVSEEATAGRLLAKASELQKEFQELLPKLEYAIAARRLHNRCDLVTFS